MITTIDGIIINSRNYSETSKIIDIFRKKVESEG